MAARPMSRHARFGLQMCLRAENTCLHGAEDAGMDSTRMATCCNLPALPPYYSHQPEGVAALIKSSANMLSSIPKVTSRRALRQYIIAILTAGATFEGTSQGCRAPA
eukprot:350803-Chlamydomonas_euryale.AAC.3